jgi:hypothetical protein
MLNTHARNPRYSVVFNVHSKLYQTFIEFTGAGTTFRQSDRHSDILQYNEQRHEFYKYSMQSAHGLSYVTIISNCHINSTRESNSGPFIAADAQ